MPRLDGMFSSPIGRSFLPTGMLLLFAAASISSVCADDRSAELKRIFDSVEPFAEAEAADTLWIDRYGDWGSAVRAVLYRTHAKKSDVSNHYSAEFRANGWEVNPIIRMTRDEVRKEAETLKESALPNRTERHMLGPVAEHWQMPASTVLNVLTASPLEPGAPIEAAAFVWLESCGLSPEVFQTLGIATDESCFIFVSSNILSSGWP